MPKKPTTKKFKPPRTYPKKVKRSVKSIRDGGQKDKDIIRRSRARGYKPTRSTVVTSARN